MINDVLSIKRMLATGLPQDSIQFHIWSELAER